MFKNKTKPTKTRKNNQKKPTPTTSHLLQAQPVDCWNRYKLHHPQWVKCPGKICLPKQDKTNSNITDRIKDLLFQEKIFSFQTASVKNLRSFILHGYRRTRGREQGKRIIFKSLPPILVLPAAMKLQVTVTTTRLSILFLVCQSTELKVYYMKINLFIMNIPGNHKLHHKCETHVI